MNCLKFRWLFNLVCWTNLYCMSAYEELIDQIDAFIRKYYRNQMLKGALLMVGVFLVSLLLVSGIEFVGQLNRYVRAVLFFTFLGLNLVILTKYIVIPLMRFFSFGKRINHLQAAQIIGRFFPQINDRLLNTLQLQSISDVGNIEIIRASVQQRVKALSVFSFTDAIQLSENWKYVKILSPVFLLVLGLSVFIPEYFTEGTARVVQYDKDFVPEAPFDFVLLNDQLITDEGSNFELKLSLNGNELPQQVFVNTERGRFLMKANSKSERIFWLEGLNKDESFFFEANGFESEVFRLQVLPRTSIGMVKAELVFPSYLNRNPEVIRNVGDLVVPEGTEVKATFVAKNTDKVTVQGNGTSKTFEKNQFDLQFKSMSSFVYDLALSNEVTKQVDSAAFEVDVVKDEFPSILVEESQDSLKTGVFYFSGRVGDDHGLKRLNFIYSILAKDGEKRDVVLPVTQVSGVDQRFEFAVDFNREKLSLNDKVEYSFRVYDNDGVNGSKSTSSQKFTYQLPGLKDLLEKRKDDQESINQNMNDLLNQSQDLKKDLERLKKESMNVKNESWKTKNELNRIQNKQEELNRSFEQVKSKMDESVQQKDKLSPMDEELLRKQEEVERLLEELMDDEMRELLKKLEELLEKQDKESFNRELDKLDNKAEEQSKQLDRSLEMLKKLQVNEKIDDVEKKLEELAKAQDELKTETIDKRLSDEELLNKQDDINKEFEEVLKDLEEIKELNEDLNRPMDIGDQKELKEQIQKDLNDAKEELGKGKNNKAGEEQKQSAEGMKQMAQELNQMQEEANAQQDGEDLEMLKRILKNLMTLSFDQEENMQQFASVLDTDPAYQKYAKKQIKIIGNTKEVADSLEALAKRQPKIASFIDGELQAIEDNHALTVEGIDEHKRRDIGIHQQYVMTSYNNLALLLNESLESLQNQMKNSKPGEGSCNKPGGKGRPKPGEGMGTKDMKQMLKDQLESLEKGMGKGPKPGEGDSPGKNGKPGNQGEGGSMGLSSQGLAKMAAEQRVIRERLEQLRKELNKDGKGRGNELNPLIDELEKQEEDLINRRINRDMINRQKEIMTRLLESEKALMERGFEEKRESKSGKDVLDGNLIRFDEYNKEKLRQIELLKSVDPGLKKYYKDKTNDYFNLSY